MHAHLLDYKSYTGHDYVGSTANQQVFLAKLLEAQRASNSDIGALRLEVGDANTPSQETDEPEYRYLNRLVGLKDQLDLQVRELKKDIGDANVPAREDREPVHSYLNRLVGLLDLQVRELKKDIGDANATSQNTDEPTHIYLERLKQMKNQLDSQVRELKTYFGDANATSQNTDEPTHIYLERLKQMKNQLDSQVRELKKYIGDAVDVKETEQGRNELPHAYASRLHEMQKSLELDVERGREYCRRWGVLTDFEAPGKSTGSKLRYANKLKVKVEKRKRQEALETASLMEQIAAGRNNKRDRDSSSSNRNSSNRVVSSSSSNSSNSGGATTNRQAFQVAAELIGQTSGFPKRQRTYSDVGDPVPASSTSAAASRQQSTTSAAASHKQSSTSTAASRQQASAGHSASRQQSTTSTAASRQQASAAHSASRHQSNAAAARGASAAHETSVASAVYPTQQVTEQSTRQALQMKAEEEQGSDRGESQEVGFNTDVDMNSRESTAARGSHQTARDEKARSVSRTATSRKPRMTMEERLQRDLNKLRPNVVALKNRSKSREVLKEEEVPGEEDQYSFKQFPDLKFYKDGRKLDHALNAFIRNKKLHRQTGRVVPDSQSDEGVDLQAAYRQYIETGKIPTARESKTPNLTMPQLGINAAISVSHGIQKVRGVMVADEPGVGKTRAVLLAAVNLLLTQIDNRIEDQAKAKVDPAILVFSTTDSLLYTLKEEIGECLNVYTDKKKRICDPIIVEDAYMNIEHDLTRVNIYLCTHKTLFCLLFNAMQVASYTAAKGQEDKKSPHFQEDKNINTKLAAGHQIFYGRDGERRPVILAIDEIHETYDAPPSIFYKPAKQTKKNTKTWYDIDLKEHGGCSFRTGMVVTDEKYSVQTWNHVKTLFDAVMAYMKGELTMTTSQSRPFIIGMSGTIAKGHDAKARVAALVHLCRGESNMWSSFQIGVNTAFDLRRFESERIPDGFCQLRRGIQLEPCVDLGYHTSNIQQMVEIVPGVPTLSVFGPIVTDLTDSRIATHWTALCKLRPWLILLDDYAMRQTPLRSQSKYLDMFNQVYYRDYSAQLRSLHTLLNKSTLQEVDTLLDGNIDGNIWKVILQKCLNSSTPEELFKALGTYVLRNGSEVKDYRTSVTRNLLSNQHDAVDSVFGTEHITTPVNWKTKLTELVTKLSTTLWNAIAKHRLTAGDALQSIPARLIDILARDMKKSPLDRRQQFRHLVLVGEGTGGLNEFENFDAALRKLTGLLSTAPLAEEKDAKTSKHSSYIMAGAKKALVVEVFAVNSDTTPETVGGELVEDDLTTESKLIRCTARDCSDPNCVKQHIIKIVTIPNGTRSDTVRAILDIVNNPEPKSLSGIVIVLDSAWHVGVTVKNITAAHFINVSTSNATAIEQMVGRVRRQNMNTRSRITHVDLYSYCTSNPDVAVDPTRFGGSTEYHRTSAIEEKPEADAQSVVISKDSMQYLGGLYARLETGARVPPCHNLTVRTVPLIAGTEDAQDYGSDDKAREVEMQAIIQEEKKPLIPVPESRLSSSSSSSASASASANPHTALTLAGYRHFPSGSMDDDAPDHVGDTPSRELPSNGRY